MNMMSRAVLLLMYPNDPVHVLDTINETVFLNPIKNTKDRHTTKRFRKNKG